MVNAVVSIFPSTTVMCLTELSRFSLDNPIDHLHELRELGSRTHQLVGHDNRFAPATDALSISG